MDRVGSTMKGVSNPLPKVLSRRAGGGGLEAERESFERVQVRAGQDRAGRGMRAARKGRCRMKGRAEAGAGSCGGGPTGTGSAGTG